MKKILVVEDNEKNMYLMNFILGKKGYEVIQAATGEKGVELAASEAPDLVLMDIALPGIDGYETTRRIRQLAGREQVPIVAITSYALAGDREKGLAAGCNGYVEKPIDPAAFLPEIEKYLI